MALLESEGASQGYVRGPLVEVSGQPEEDLSQKQTHLFGGCKIRSWKYSENISEELSLGLMIRPIRQ